MLAEKKKKKMKTKLNSIRQVTGREKNKENCQGIFTGKKIWLQLAHQGIFDPKNIEELDE